MMMIDAFDYQDKAIYRGLAGGVTTSLLLHGSANMIGGQAIVIKHKYGAGRDAMLFPNAHGPSSLPAGKPEARLWQQRARCHPRAWEILPCNARHWWKRRITCGNGIPTMPK
jgi:hypothetical protein